MKHLTLEDVELQFATRKYRHFFYDFGADHVEANYKAWVEVKSRPFRMLCSLAFFLIFSVLAVSILIEGSTLRVTNWVILVISLLLLGGNLLLAWGATTPMIQVTLFYGSCVLFVIAIGASVPRGTSLTTNIPEYLFFVVTLLGVGNVGIVGAGTQWFVSNFLVFTAYIIITSSQIGFQRTDWFVGQTQFHQAALVIFLVTVQYCFKPWSPTTSSPT